MRRPKNCTGIKIWKYGGRRRRRHRNFDSVEYKCRYIRNGVVLSVKGDQIIIGRTSKYIYRWGGPEESTGLVRNICNVADNHGANVEALLDAIYYPLCRDRVKKRSHVPVHQYKKIVTKYIGDKYDKYAYKHLTEYNYGMEGMRLVDPPTYDDDNDVYRPVVNHNVPQIGRCKIIYGNAPRRNMPAVGLLNIIVGENVGGHAREILDEIVNVVGNNGFVAMTLADQRIDNNVDNVDARNNDVDNVDNVDVDNVDVDNADNADNVGADNNGSDIDVGEVHAYESDSDDSDYNDNNDDNNRADLDKFNCARAHLTSEGCEKMYTLLATRINIVQDKNWQDANRIDRPPLVTARQLALSVISTYRHIPGDQVLSNSDIFSDTLVMNIYYMIRSMKPLYRHISGKMLCGKSDAYRATAKTELRRYVHFYNVNIAGHNVINSSIVGYRAWFSMEVLDHPATNGFKPNEYMKHVNIGMARYRCRGKDRQHYWHGIIV